MKSPATRHACLIVLLAVLGCGGEAAVGAAPLTDEDRAALQRFADDDCAIVTSADWDALAAGYSDDAVRMPPGAPPIAGRAAIRSSLDQVPPITRCEFEAQQIDGSARIAFMRASYDMTFAPPAGDTVRDAGKILIVFEKQPDGSWLRVADAWNSSGALP